MFGGPSLGNQISPKNATRGVQIGNTISVTKFKLKMWPNVRGLSLKLGLHVAIDIAGPAPRCAPKVSSSMPCKIKTLYLSGGDKLQLNLP